MGSVFAYAVTVASPAADPFSASEASDSVLVYTSLLLYVVARGSVVQVDLEILSLILRVYLAVDRCGRWFQIVGGDAGLERRKICTADACLGDTREG